MGCRESRSPGAISGTSRRASACVWDPQGEGRETLRVAYGRLYDLPHLQTYTGLAQMSPWGNAITLNSFPRGWDDPWAATPGGDPIPELLKGPSANSVFPLAGNYTAYPLDLQAIVRRSVERQLPAAGRSRLDGVGELHRQHDEARLDHEPDQSGGVQSRRDDGHHASTSRAESAESRGRQGTTPASRSSTTMARRPTTGCCCLCSGAAATACRYRATTPSRGASATDGTASQASPACRS